MLPSSSEIRILRKQSRKGSDVKRNRITRKQKPPRLAVFQKLFSLDSVGNHFPITLGSISVSPILFQITCDVIANMKGWRKKQVVEIVSEFRWAMKEIRSQEKQQCCLLSQFYHQDKLETAIKPWILLHGTLLFYCNCNIVTTEDPSKDALEKTENYANWKLCKVQIVY